MDSLQSELRKQIDGKKYFLVMDDVWNEDHEKWVSLKRLLMGGAKGSRILITTRAEQVAKTFDTSSFFSLQNLDEFNSWLLFKKMVFSEGQENELENSNLVEIGKEIVEKLRGVPLAIRTIGRLLKEKKSQKFWLSFKDKELYQVMEQGKTNELNYMQSILELSYKHLSANLKTCFLYCALFPKDYEIKKDELILLWRAQGFIPPNDKDELIDIGEDYFLELLSKSFFQEVTKNKFGNIETCKMHDLMHDLACSISKNECIHGREKVTDKRTLHLSWSKLSLYELEKFRETLSKARNLRTLYMLPTTDGNWILGMEKMFHNHFQLRALKLDGFPSLFWKEKFNVSFIGKFKHLRYLNICKLYSKELPNCITELYNLETLILAQWESLESLPTDIKHLINLKHLDLSRNKSIEFLPDTITKLHKLEVIILRGCTKLKALPRDVKNWINLRHLDLSHVDIEFLPDSITELINLETLILCLATNFNEWPSDIKRMINLKHLDISSCRVLTHMPKGLGELTNLQTLTEFVVGEDNGAELNELNDLNKLTKSLSITNLQFCSVVDLQIKDKFLQHKASLQTLMLKWYNSHKKPTVDKLSEGYGKVLDCLRPHSNLQDISIHGYKGVKLCSWLSSGSLGHLVRISLVNCERLQHLPQFDQFPYLNSLYLENLPSIEYIDNNDAVSSSIFFPSLERLSIKGMPNLKRWWKGTTSTESSVSKGSFSVIFPCLSRLEISCFHLHILMSLHAPLEELEICDSEERHGEEVHGIEEDEFDIVPWQNFENLSSLSLSSLSKLEYLPKCLQHIATLRRLDIQNCENLRSLPEWINNLTSLTKLKIFNSRKLTSLPEGISHIHGLRSLDIIQCPILEERCKKDTGEDWPKIQHIPEVFISWLLP